MSAVDWKREVVALVEETNRQIRQLNARLRGLAGELYRVPPNPTPAHLERMRADLEALVADVDGADHVEVLVAAVDENLAAIRAQVSRHRVPRAPLYHER